MTIGSEYTMTESFSVSKRAAGRSGMYPTPSSSTSVPHFPPLAASGMTDPFHYMIKIFAIAYRVTQVLVRPDVVDAGELLEKAQSDLNEFNTSLPPELRFETSTFRNYAAIAQGGAFVMIHVSVYFSLYANCSLTTALALVPHVS
jgi:hypothetical protein